MYVYIYIIWRHVYIYIHTYIQASTCMHVYLYLRVYIQCIHIYALYVCFYLWVYIDVCIICMYVYIVYLHVYVEPIPSYPIWSGWSWVVPGCPKFQGPWWFADLWVLESMVLGRSSQVSFACPKSQACLTSSQVRLRRLAGLPFLVNPHCGSKLTFC